MRSILFVLGTSILFSGISAYASPVRSWQWTIDESPTEIRITPKGFIYSSSTRTVALPSRSCSKRLLDGFIKTLDRQIASYKKPKVIPKGYSPIYLRTPSSVNALVLRGTDLGKHLILMSNRISELDRNVRQACR